MPVHTHHRTEPLKTERIAQSSQHFGPSVFGENAFGDGQSQFGHTLGKPYRHGAIMQRKICGTRAFHPLNLLTILAKNWLFIALKLLIFRAAGIWLVSLLMNHLIEEL